MHNTKRLAAKKIGINVHCNFINNMYNNTRMSRVHIANEYITVEGVNLYEKYAVSFLKELAEADM